MYQNILNAVIVALFFALACVASYRQGVMDGKEDIINLLESLDETIVELEKTEEGGQSNE